MASSSHSFHSSLGAGPSWGYGGYDYLGPTIEVTRGTPVSINVVNNLGEHPLKDSLDTSLHGALASDATSPRTVVHLHGSNTDATSDGYPELTFTPGQNFVYNFNNAQEAATLWYHDHALGITRVNVQAGLTGFYLLRDTDDPAGGNGPLGIPAGPPYEVPLVLQDRSFKSDGSQSFDAPWDSLYFGDVATVNGKAWPNLNVDRTMYRFRILNGSSSRFYNLKLSSNQPIFQIGTDGGFLNAPVPLSQLLLGPAERADVLIDFSNHLPGDKIVLQNDANAPYPKGIATFGGNFPLPEIMQFTVNAGAAVPGVVPNKLRLHKPLISPIATEPVRQRFLTLVDIVMVPPGITKVVLLNCVYWDEATQNPEEFMERPRVDTVEQWNIINLQPVAHPIHIHLVPFQILNRQNIDAERYRAAYYAATGGPRQVRINNATGGPTVPAGYPPIDPAPYVVDSPIPPAPNEAGWKDSVIVYPNSVTRIIIPFGAKAAPNLPFENSFTGRFVWHCHMLNHEDNEMMLPFDVVN
jgi:FtsP/CotA-like multicopper oxidase with cupredoxin domain